MKGERKRVKRRKGLHHEETLSNVQHASVDNYERRLRRLQLAQHIRKNWHGRSLDLGAEAEVRRVEPLRLLHNGGALLLGALRLLYHGQAQGHDSKIAQSYGRKKHVYGCVGTNVSG